MKEGMKNTAINSSNIYVDINGKGKGTLTGSNVDPQLTQAHVERVFRFKEWMTRNVEPPSESTLFSAGQINASPIELTILRTQLSPYVRQCFYSATCIEKIVVYRVDIIGSMYKVTEKIQYSNCYILECGDLADVLDREATDPHLSHLHFAFRFTKRQGTLYSFDQEGRPLGQEVTLIDFVEGTLKPS